MGELHQLRQTLVVLLAHPSTAVRLHAHRTARSALDRPGYLRLTVVLLGDPQPGVVRSAILTLSHAAWEPAFPALTGLLLHPHTAVRRAAAEGLVRIGTPAVPALRRAADHARPDRRPRYTELLARLARPTGR